MPSWKRAKAEELGQFKLQMSMAELYLPFLSACRDKIDLQVRRGVAAVAEAYDAMSQAGNRSPDSGAVLSVWEDGEERPPPPPGYTPPSRL